MILTGLYHSGRILTGLLLGRWLRRYPRLPAIGAGMLWGCQVFCLLPGCLPLLPTLIPVPAFVLGIIGGVFLKEIVKPKNFTNLFILALAVHSLCLGLNATPLPVPLLWYFTSVGLLSAPALPWAAPPAYLVGVILHHWCSPPLRLCGMLLAVSCGLVLQTAPRLPLSARWLGGLALALMIATM